MATFINSKKFDGVQYYLKADGTRSYYIRFKNDLGKLSRVKVGDEQDGTTEIYCKNKRIEIINALTKGEQPPKIVKNRRQPTITLDDVAEKYFESKKPSKSTSDRISKYNKHLSPILGSFPIQNIKKSHLEELKQDCVHEKGLSEKTANMIIELYSTIFNFGFKDEMYEFVNQATKVTRFTINNTRERFLQKNEIEELYQEARSLDERAQTGGVYELFIKLALSTGGRLEGILNLQKKDIDLYNGIIRITDFKKGGEKYTSYITDTTRELLTTRLSRLNFNDLIICFDDNGEKVSSRQMQTVIKPLLDRLFNVGIDHQDRKNRIVIHSLRHTFASHLALNNVPLLVIQSLLNHSDIRQSIRYSKLQDETKKLAVQGVF